MGRILVYEWVGVILGGFYVKGVLDFIVFVIR